MKVQRPRVGWGLWHQWLLATVVGLALGGAVVGLAGHGMLGPGVGAVLGGSVGATQGLVLRRHMFGAGWWVLASMVGLAVGDVAGHGALGSLFGAADEPALGTLGEALSHGVVGAVGGVSLGIGQWLVLRRPVSRAGWWIVAASVGGALGEALGHGVVEGPVGHLVGAIVIGTVTAFALARLLRRPSHEGRFPKRANAQGTR